MLLISVTTYCTFQISSINQIYLAAVRVDICELICSAYMIQHHNLFTLENHRDWWCLVSLTESIPVHDKSSSCRPLTYNMVPKRDIHYQLTLTHWSRCVSGTFSEPQELILCLDVNLIHGFPTYLKASVRENTVSICVRVSFISGTLSGTQKVFAGAQKHF